MEEKEVKFCEKCGEKLDKDSSFCSKCGNESSIIKKNNNQTSKKSSLATTGMVLGIIAFCTSCIPIINNLSFIMGLLALIFGIISLVKKKGTGKAITALVLGILSIILTITSQGIFSDALDDVSNDLNKTTGENTEEVLKQDADVSLGKFETKKDEFGLEDTKLTVTLTNKSSKTQTFSVKVEALDSNGSRLETENAYFDTVAPGQTVTDEIFTLITSEKVKAYKKATFKILEVSAY